MKLHQLVEQIPQINDAFDIKNAFSRNEWTNIAYYYLSKKFPDMTPTQFGARLKKFNRDIGIRMPNNTTQSQWAARAKYYNIPVQSRDTWRQIFALLSPASKVASKIDPLTVDPVQNAPKPLDASRTSLEEFTSWFPRLNVEEFDNYEFMRDNFLDPWLNTLSRKRANWVSARNRTWWFHTIERKVKNSTPDTEQKEEFVFTRKNLDNIRKKWQDQLSLTNKVRKQDVIRTLYNWLLEADQVWDGHIEREKNQ